MTDDSLVEFRTERKRWLDMLNGNDEHAISRQIVALLDADLQFQTINQARTLCADAGILQNGMLHQFIDRGFIAHQSLAIRRITDPPAPAHRANRAVYSLPTIITEVKAKRELITRRNFVCADGDAYNESLSQPDSFHRHMIFDGLAGTDRGNRSPDDLIREEILADLDQRLEEARTVRTYVNKVLAHGADPKTRNIPLADLGLCLRDFERAYEVVIWVAYYLSARILYGASYEFLLTYAFDTLEHFENPLCPPSASGELRQYQRARHAELEDLERRCKSEPSFQSGKEGC